MSVTQLDLLAGELFVRAWQAGLGPWVHGTVIVDMDSTIAPVFSSAKEGAAYGYTKTLGYHPLVATIADTGEIVAIANRDGNANTATGSRRMLSTIVARLRNHLDIGYSVGVRRTSRMWDLINTIDDDRWVPIDYRSGVAQVAQTWDNAPQ